MLVLLKSGCYYESSQAGTVVGETGVKSDLPYPILGMSGLMLGEIRHELRWAVYCMAVGGEGRGSNALHYAAIHEN